ncbi:unnamed protein product [Rangifer tarandus platyrhynchus]|uniref:Uncharacterized protein n=9 Tax=Rangifer tarandus platyrhynchus TaxID=3082113 RepID=A0ABN8XMV8_RANTA|nr:unnamed protein product [Rangifer tarandus platyrhynchus]
MSAGPCHLSRLPASYFVPQDSQKELKPRSQTRARARPGHTSQNSSDSPFPSPKKGPHQAGVCRTRLSLEVSEAPFAPSGPLDSSKPHEEPLRLYPSTGCPTSQLTWR